MYQFFYNKFQYRPNRDLQYIIDNPNKFEFEAIQAANAILQERIENPQSDTYPSYKKVKRSISEEPTNIRPFFRSLSSRDFFTYFTLALLYLTVLNLLSFYSDESYVQNNLTDIKMWFFVGLLSLSHIMYKLEHKRSNNYLGRIFNDLFLVSIISVVQNIYWVITGNPRNILDLLADIPGMVIVLILIFLILEAAVGIVKRLLKLIRCEIL